MHCYPLQDTTHGPETPRTALYAPDDNVGPAAPERHPVGVGLVDHEGPLPRASSGLRPKATWRATSRERRTCSSSSTYQTSSSAARSRSHGGVASSR